MVIVAEKHQVVKLKTETPTPRSRDDGRRQLLIYLKQDIIKDLKRAALDEGRPAYEIAEEAIVEFLKVKKRKK
jgi:hypothetical protein